MRIAPPIMLMLNFLNLFYNILLQEYVLSNKVIDITFYMIYYVNIIGYIYNCIISIFVSFCLYAIEAQFIVN